MHEQTKYTSADWLIPDCCNIGIVFRVLIVVNFSVLLSLLARGQGWLLNLQDFIETAMLVEMISLLSLFVLCGVRRLAERDTRQHKPPAWLQRLACGLVPAMVAILLLRALEPFEWFVFSFPRLNDIFTTVLCFVFGLAFQHYFELRSRAYSPALGEARLQALQARIRPHFLFNSLNAVLSLIRVEPRRAETALEDLADLFRVLMRDTRDITTLKEEIDLCRQYLAIEKIRLGDRLQVEWNTVNLTPQELRDTKIASLLLQPLLENAVHYGVEPSQSAALISITIQRSLDKIEIRISNPFHTDADVPGGNQMALENIRQRLRLLYDIEAQMTNYIVDDHFVVQLYFPYKK
ncbi:histidine kinase [Undibacterium sp. Jales W-56]|uniref:sensor histidine kinase n=1 Tax=Undibacterium sp. Jales W-56 TaxID=2897325 RepID=UPI0021D1E06D|nr:histidine kinase [Undibacterium sp. Jales W-56]MCU6433723.1 histidine kinase [Undibacterium sp. Jales W-56]